MKTYLLAISLISLFLISFTSCSTDGDMGSGLTEGELDPPRGARSPIQIIDTIPSTEGDTITPHSLND